MSTLEAKKIAARYASQLRKIGYPIEKIYLFGSTVKRNTDEASDIDIAVISKKFRDADDRTLLEIWKARRQIDTRIEPHAFTPEDFMDDNNPFVYEIKRTGLVVSD